MDFLPPRGRLSAERAYVVSLPYDYDFNEYNDPTQARVYRMAFKEEFYKQFIFLPDQGARPNLMRAGRAYLVVVLRGELNLSATGVMLSNESVTYDNLEFESSISNIEDPTGIQPTILTIDADGTNRYFDMQGRLLNGKPFNYYLHYKLKELISSCRH